MKYYYFVSYFSSENETSFSKQAISNCQLVRDKKIDTYEDIENIGKLLEENYNRKNVVILNYILLKTAKEVK